MKIVKSLTWVVLSILFSLPQQAISQPPAIGASLIADVTAVTPGRKFTAGVHFTIPDGWHIYWKTPGQAGLPTKVALEAPDGFSVGPVLWPNHIKFTQPGGLDGYGYEHEVVLLQEITAPAALEYGTTVVIKASVSWLACNDICVPGRKSLILDLPVGNAERSGSAALLEEWLKKVPATD